jgi:hypothetical protein
MADPTLDAVKQQLGLTTSQTAQILDTMAQGEGMPAWENNPLASTQRMPGSYSVNSAGVQAYPTPQIGALATIQTLQNGNFPNIWSLLQQKADITKYNTTGVQKDLHAWQQGPNAPGLASGDWSLLQKLFGNVTAIQQETQTGNASVGDLPGSGVIPGIVGWGASLGTLLGWLTQSQHWWQIAFVLGGGILVVTGALMMRGGGAPNVVQELARV